MSKRAIFISFQDTRRGAFARGFWKGLASPLTLYIDHDMPKEACPLAFRPLKRQSASPMSDWVKVGDQLREAARKDRELSEAGG